MSKIHETFDSSKTPFDHAALRTRLVEILKSQEEMLPPAQSPLGRLYELFQSPDSSVDDCVEVIKLDPAMTARIFRLANSVAYRGKVSAISEAVLHLGFGQVRQIAFSAAFFKQFSHLELPPEMAQFWLRNLLVARMTERICAQFQRFGGLEYLAGLLHDTGWLLLAAHFPIELGLITVNGKPSPEGEKEVLAFTHAEIAAAICSTSLLPPRVTNAVMHHHDPLSLVAKDEGRGAEQGQGQDEDLFLAVVLSLCDKIADAAGLEIPWQRTGSTLETVAKSQEAVWLASFKKVILFERLIEEELPKAREIWVALSEK